MNKDKIIVALDVDSAEKAVKLAAKLKDDVGAFKVGLQLINSAGLGIFDELKAAGAKNIFYDCKYHDIPNTVKGASEAACAMGIWMFNVHCSGGYTMMKAAADAAKAASEQLGKPRPLVIGVTVLTSIDKETLNNDIRVPGEPAEQVVHLAKLAKEAGLDGVVSSPLEIELIREACGPDFLIVTPGVRHKGADVGDQKRIMTPAEAVAKGSDYLVIGRPITKAEDPAQAARNIAAEL